MHAWHIWFFVAILFFIIEIYTPGFVPACFGIGCLASALAAFLKFNFQIQNLAFSATTLVVFFGLRPLILQYFFKSTDNIKTNSDALINKIGRGIVNGDDWRAIFADENIIDLDEKIEDIKVGSSNWGCF